MVFPFYCFKSDCLKGSLYCLRCIKIVSNCFTSFSNFGLLVKFKRFYHEISCHAKAHLFYTGILLFYSCKDAAKSHTSTTLRIKIVGGPFEHLGWMFDDIPKELNEVDTSSAWIGGERKIDRHRQGQSSISMEAMWLQNVIVYHYHTNEQGLYVHDAAFTLQYEAKEWSEPWCVLWGWVKTKWKGRIPIYTIRPAPYPDRTIPAHIHLTVKEPNDLRGLLHRWHRFWWWWIVDSTYPAMDGKEGRQRCCTFAKER